LARHARRTGQGLGKLCVAAVVDHATLHRDALVLRKLVEQLEHDTVLAAVKPIDSLDRLVTQEQWFDPQALAGAILDASALPQIGKLVARDPEQPRSSRAVLRVKADRGLKSCREHLAGEVRCEVGAPRRAPENARTARS